MGGEDMPVAKVTQGFALWGHGGRRKGSGSGGNVPRRRCVWKPVRKGNSPVTVAFSKTCPNITQTTI